MVDSEYSMDIHKSVKIVIRIVMKNPKMLRFILNHLKTTNMCKHAVKKLLYLLRYVPDQCKCVPDQQMCNKAISENGGTLKSVPDCYKNQEMCV